MTNLRFADDWLIVALSADHLHSMLVDLVAAASVVGLELRFGTTRSRDKQVAESSSQWGS